MHEPNFRGLIASHDRGWGYRCFLSCPRGPSRSVLVASGSQKIVQTGHHQAIAMFAMSPKF